MQIIIEISEDAYKKLTQKSMLMSASAIDEAVDAVKKGIVISNADALVDSLSSSDRDNYCKAVIEEEASTIIAADNKNEG